MPHYVNQIINCYNYSKTEKGKYLMNHCIFCKEIKTENILANSEHFFAVLDIDPIQQGHILIISKKHYLNMRQIPPNELTDLILFEKKIVTLLEDDFKVLGVSIIQNNGKVMDYGTHFHVHIVPRYSKDMFWNNQNVNQHSMNLVILKDKLSLLKLAIMRLMLTLTYRDILDIERVRFLCLKV